MEWMKPRIKSTIWNTRKKKALNQNSKKKKEFKKKRERESTHHPLEYSIVFSFVLSSYQ